LNSVEETTSTTRVSARSEIERALASQRFETARRLAVRLSHSDDGAKWLLHLACRAQGDFATGESVLREIAAESDAERLEIELRLAEDYSWRAEQDHYRISAEARRGLTLEEYEQIMRKRMAEALDRAKVFVHGPSDQLRFQGAVDICERRKKAAAPKAVEAETPDPGSVAGVIRFSDNTPAAGATVTLGLQVEVIEPDLPNCLVNQLTYAPEIGPQGSLQCQTDSRGMFRFENVPAGVQEFIAVSLDPSRFAVATRFLAHHIEVSANGTTELELLADEWVSAPAAPIQITMPDEIVRSGIRYRKISQQSIRNPFYFDFPRQLIHLSLPEAISEGGLLVLDSDAPGACLDVQVRDGRVAVMSALRPMSEKAMAVYQAESKANSDEAPAKSVAFDISRTSQTADIDTGRSRFRISWTHATLDAPPLVSVKGEDGVWRGRGRLRLPAGVRVISRRCRVIETGPLLLTVHIDHLLSTGQHFEMSFTAHRDEAYLLVHERCAALPHAAFEFSLAEFTGGRGFLQWTPEDDRKLHWTTLKSEDAELARLQESVPWWIPPAGFAYAMTPGGLDAEDYIGVFTIRRGDWIDREFERISQGPGDDRRELDWPFPEMVGSTISMITAHTDAQGDAFFRFGFFDGERHWGLLVSTLDRNDGAYKELSSVQHKNSSPRLDDFKDWRLDEADHIARPFVVARRENILALRQKRQSPGFSEMWKRICAGGVPGPAAGLRSLIDGDPLFVWRRKRELVSSAHVRSRMTLLGRDYADMYSPVGARQITPAAEDYDLIAGSGVFTPEEERLVRQFFMLMGHLHMSPDLMNWKFNSRNANFEADRVDVIGAIGLAFHGNPDAKKFIDHGVALMQRSIEVYCTPGSGKWYENPACYYLGAARCRMNLAYHLASHGILDVTTIERLKDFLRWGVLLLTPATPRSYDDMRLGISDQQYRATAHMRRIPPVGDHAHIGPKVPDHYLFMAKLYRKSDPEFADLLAWAWQVGGADGQYFGNLPLLFSELSEEDLAPAPAQTLQSRRLEGFGAVFRGHFNQPDEFYLLIKQGPGGYRYHRTEGSIILFADGKPLIYDGGEAGETWRHSTLSFYAEHMPLAAGHVERFFSLPGADFCQGVHPVALKPGDPVFLSDNCHHSLVEVAVQRFHEPKPADSRSVLWMKDEYVILHDELNLPPDTPSHWHLQVVSDAHTGDWRDAEGYRFTGRFGSDLQVLLPGQTFIGEKIEQTPILEYHRTAEMSFSMRHLSLEARQARSYLAILRPLGPGRAMLRASAIIQGESIVGANVVGDGIADRLFFSRSGLRIEDGDLGFDGRYGAIAGRRGRTDLLLLDGQRLRFGNIELQSDGPAIQLSVFRGHAQLVCEGSGAIRVRIRDCTTAINVDGRISVQLRA
jgi:hypothetical protein